MYQYQNQRFKKSIIDSTLPKSAFVNEYPKFSAASFAVGAPFFLTPALSACASVWIKVRGAQCVTKPRQPPPYAHSECLGVHLAVTPIKLFRPLCLVQCPGSPRGHAAR